MDAKMQIIDILEELVEKELKEFIWQLWNGVTPNVEAIPRGKLEKADRQDVVDHMERYYGENAGMIAVEALRKSKQNERAKRLESKLQKDQQLVKEEARNAPMSEEPKPVQSDWQRPRRVTACRQDFKTGIKSNKVYKPTDRHQQKGLALVITNIKFKYLDYRNGADKDEENIEWLLKALGYSVEKAQDLTGEEIKTKVKNFSKRHEHQDSDSTFVVIMSHGARIENKDAILGVNYDLEDNPNDFYFVEDTFQHLNSKNCSALIDKPKVLLIQACRGNTSCFIKCEEYGGVSVQEPRPESDAHVHKEKDFVLFMSCVPDVRAYRHPRTGSYFICHIVDVICECAHEDHIMELFREVSSRMEKDAVFKDREEKILPCIERSNLVRDFYLFPGL